MILPLLLSAAFAQTLEQQLAAEEPAALARDARRLGDPVRGAFVFFRPALGCARCHAPDPPAAPLGPDPAAAEPKLADEAVVESILAPSRQIRKGYETVAVVTRDGETVTGLLAEERPDALVLRDAAQEGRSVTIPRARIESRADRP